MKEKKTMMERNELREMSLEITKALNAKNDSKQLLEVIFKFISTASLAMVIWVVSTANATQKDIIGIKSDMAYMKSSLDKLENFSDEPRFTQLMYDAQTLPLMGAITTLTEAIKNIEQRMNANDLERQKMIISIQALEKKK